MKFYLRSYPPPESRTEKNSCYADKNRNSNQAISIAKPPKHSAGHKPPPKKKKLNFKCLKKDTINSLNEVEHFLCNFQNIYKYIKLYKILK